MTIGEHKVILILAFVALVVSEESQQCKTLLYPFNTWCKRLNRWADRWKEAFSKTERFVEYKMQTIAKKKDQRADRSTKSFQECKMKNCASCSTGKTCSKCLPGFYLQPLRHRKMTLCVHRCVWGYEVQTRAKSSGVCLSSKKAVTCTTIHCFRCLPGFYQISLGFLKRRCISSCPKGYVTDRIRRRCHKSFTFSLSKLRHGYPT